MGSNHTPGEWFWLSPSTLCSTAQHKPVVLCAGRNGELLQRGEGGLLVPFDPKSPDGRLIAAGPELLKVLKRFVRFFDVLESMGGATPKEGAWYRCESGVAGAAEITIEDFKAARAAIAKAGEATR